MVCALGAAVCFGTATVLQAVAARAATAGGGGEAALLLRALRQWRYMAGLALDGLGFVLQIAALRSIPIYAVAAALASSLAVTGVVAARLLHVRLSGVEWGAVGVVCAGLAMLGLASGEEGDRAGSTALKWAMLAVAVVVLLLGLVGGRWSGRGRALMLGLGAGFGFGVVEVSVRLIDSLAPSELFTNPATYALLLGGGAAFLLLTTALQRGSVTTATAGLVIGETIGPAAVGVVWLGDRTREGLAWLAVLGFVIAIAGALALARFGEAPAEEEAKEEEATA
ncbi:MULTISPECIES: DMT family transporter [unclassified Streptomyces]|uniref:DMT family transporter n=1 Tax=unclassified Streptomyces TaxID=2593676 RepID=UPI00225685CA|nr:MULTISPECIES: DMT family transporter [unclassified Streptomyces]MCX4883116.1 DMT family transporter [Streptomyces sp. NBC_00847]MCX5050562.1 DMT family transporter [Streptomyces sp. NBC_00474]MCX5248470.1 DMT family transporter [Streptomyces sp. NBC_00201]